MKDKKQMGMEMSSLCHLQLETLPHQQFLILTSSKLQGNGWTDLECRTMFLFAKVSNSLMFSQDYYFLPEHWEFIRILTDIFYISSDLPECEMHLCCYRGPCPYTKTWYTSRLPNHWRLCQSLYGTCDKSLWVQYDQSWCSLQSLYLGSQSIKAWVHARRNHKRKPIWKVIDGPWLHLMTINKIFQSPLKNLIRKGTELIGEK